jgi:regulator of sigma E protease
MDILSNLFYFIIIIGVLVAIHEFGHFLAARLCGMRAEIFSIGMGYRLCGWNKVNGFTFGRFDETIEMGNHTDYRLAVFPIGGFVKISGMIDESVDTEFLNTEPQPYEFRSKNTFQKMFVLSAGVIMNIILAVFVFSLISYVVITADLAATIIGKVENSSIGSKLGFQTNDKVISINGNSISTWNQFLENLTLKEFGNNLNIEVLRNSQRIFLKVQGSTVLKYLAKKEKLGLIPGGITTYIDSVFPGLPAAKAGIKSGDTIISINKIQVNTSSVLQETLKMNQSKMVHFVWKRGNIIFADSLVANAEGMIGVKLGHYPIKYTSFGVFESIGNGFKECISSIELLLKSIAQIFKGNLSFKESIGGPIMIMNQAGNQANQGLLSFLHFMALLSISLAFMNILPFPALDGGHLVFVLIEGIIRKELPVKIKLAFQQGGIIILLLFMAYVFFNDITRLIK